MTDIDELQEMEDINAEINELFRKHELSQDKVLAILYNHIRVTYRVMLRINPTESAFNGLMKISDMSQQIIEQDLAEYIKELRRS